MTTAGALSGAVLACRVDRRRKLVRDRGLNGIDDIDVGDVDPGDHSVTLCVHFLGPVPKDAVEVNIRVDRCRSAPQLRVLKVEPKPAIHEDDDDCLEVVLDRPGDASTYTLCLVEADEYGRPGREPFHGFDARYHCRSFTFTASCASDLDCLVDTTCVPTLVATPHYDYLAKDYASFRRLILDRWALLVPGWRERHVPDVGIMLVELLAYIGDQLSYYQDAVATEAYLETARQRISVRRHGRLVDYTLHEGCNARAFVAVEVEEPVSWPAEDVVFLTSFAGGPPPGRPLGLDDLPPAEQAGYRCFEPLLDIPGAPLQFSPRRNAIRLHTWGDRECCVPAGATSVTLVDGRADEDALGLACGDFLVFEEVLGPETGAPGDADPSHRHVVRLTSVEKGDDEIEDQGVLEVCWAPEDALPFPLCVSSIGPPPDCRPLIDVSVVRGNVVLVDDGCRVEEPLPPVPELPSQPTCEGECHPAEETPRAGRFRLRLDVRDLTFAEPLPGPSECGCAAPAAAFTKRDPHTALPAITLRPAPQKLTSSEDGGWKPRIDLLASGPDDRHFAVEIDDDRVAWLRFGDDRAGEEPEPGTAFVARYRVGNGSGGNVGADSIAHVALRGRSGDVGVRVRNPLPASGGTPPEDVTEAKLTIPISFRAGRQRAVTGGDYAEIAKGAAAGRLQRAAGRLVWTGSWYRAEVALDPRGGALPTATCGCSCRETHECRYGCNEESTLESGVVRVLERARRLGHDLAVEIAEAVPIDLQLTACMLPHFVRGAVKAALTDAFSSRVLIDGRLAFFHPDRWTFGDSVHVSQVVAWAQAIPGVESVEVTRLVRQGDVDRGERTAGVLTVGRGEVIMLDADPTRPRSGRFEVVTRGGR